MPVTSLVTLISSSSGPFRNQHVILRRMYSTAISAFVSDDDDDDDNVFNYMPKRVGESNLAKEIVGVTGEISKLFRNVATTIKSLDWDKNNMSSTLMDCGFSYLSEAYRIIVQIFAYARMHMEVHYLLRDMVRYCELVKLDLFELSPNLLDSSSNNGSRPVVVFDVLIKVFAENKMLEMQLMRSFKLINLVLGRLFSRAISCSSVWQK
ncbi:LOW QUALITY PROTEIN: hypothetical protein LguiA_004769 [Lonicera macranthoides]